MIRKSSRKEARVKRHYRLRNNLSGTAEKPRLAVFRSNKHIYAQIIDDVIGNTLVSASTMEKSFGEGATNTVDAAKIIGETIAQRALEKGITTVVFDRGGFIYQGRVQALADGAREKGLQF